MTFYSTLIPVFLELLMFAKPEDKGGAVLQVGVGAIKIEFYCFKVLYSVIKKEGVKNICL